MMVKNILFLVICLVFFLISWGVFQLFGIYTFIIMQVITIALLLSRIGKPKFGKDK
jgi:hypothetical protein